MILTSGYAGLAEPRREGGRRSRSSTNNRVDERTKHRWDRAVECLSALLDDNIETGVVQNYHPLSTDAPFQLWNSDPSTTLALG